MLIVGSWCCRVAVPFDSEEDNVAKLLRKEPTRHGQWAARGVSWSDASLPYGKDGWAELLNDVLNFVTKVTAFEDLWLPLGD